MPKKDTIHDGRISVRVTEDLKRRAAQAARREGMSLSEAIRQSLRELARESEG